MSLINHQFSLGMIRLVGLTFGQRWGGFGLVTEALAAAVACSADGPTRRAVTARSGHPGRGGGESGGVREKDMREETLGEKRTGWRTL